MTLSLKPRYRVSQGVYLLTVNSCCLSMCGFHHSPSCLPCSAACREMRPNFTHYGRLNLTEKGSHDEYSSRHKIGVCHNEMTLLSTSKHAGTIKMSVETTTNKPCAKSTHHLAQPWFATRGHAAVDSLRRGGAPPPTRGQTPRETTSR